jgi:predicted O-methyltransferase YrrM
MLKGLVNHVASAPDVLRYFWLLGRSRRLDLDHIPTHLTRPERLKLYDLAGASRGNCLEVGSYLGASASFLALGLRDARVSASVYCVDTWQNDAMTEGSRDTYARFLKNVSPFGDSIVPLRGSSREVAREFGGRVSLLFIDGDHSYEGVRADIEAWLDSVEPGGTVVFHDIGWAVGVQRAVAEFVEPICQSSGRSPNLYWARL